MSSKDKGKKAVKRPILIGVAGGFILPSDLRNICGLDQVLTIKAREWTSVERLVDAYSENVNAWSSFYLQLDK